MTLKKMTALMIEAGLLQLEHQARSDAWVAPWRDALLSLKAGDVESASEIAARAYGSGASLEVRREVIDTISMVAVEKGEHGHWYESLLLLAAEGGLSHCAYNVGNLISQRASTPAEHALAHRYYTQAAKNATDPATKASALVNSCDPIRDGLLTGTPDWEKAVEIYEQAAELNLAVGMFNAGNVSCWLKDKGQDAFAARAVKWFTRLIQAVDEGRPFVDIGGDSEVLPVYRSAKSRLAELHAMNQVEVVDVDFILSAAQDDPDPQRGAWLRNRGYDHRLRTTPVQAKPAAWENWLSVLSIMGWELDSTPVELNLGPDTGDSRLLSFKRSSGGSLALAVVDLDELESNGGVYRLAELTHDIQATQAGPCLAIGAKGLFVQVNTADSYNSYSVLVSTTADGEISFIPIWPGATPDALAKLVEGDAPLHTEENADNGNTIPILINALGAGESLSGDSFPVAIYVNVGGFINSPVFSVAQGLNLSHHLIHPLKAEAIADALADVKAHFADLEARRQRYLGNP